MRSQPGQSECATRKEREREKEKEKEREREREREREGGRTAYVLMSTLTTSSGSTSSGLIVPAALSLGLPENGFHAPSCAAPPWEHEEQT